MRFMEEDVKTAIRVIEDLYGYLKYDAELFHGENAKEYCETAGVAVEYITEERLEEINERLEAFNVCKRLLQLLMLVQNSEFATPRNRVTVTGGKLKRVRCDKYVDTESLLNFI